MLTTNSGRSVNPFYMTEDDLDIDDIAHALSNICRFNGHCDHFYSVAQHSVLVSYHVPDEFAVAALLHDAPEAYLMDVPRPMKPMLMDLVRAEQSLSKMIQRWARCQPLDADPIKEADLRALATENRDLFTNAPGWPAIEGVSPFDAAILPWTPLSAKSMFLNRLFELVEG